MQHVWAFSQAAWSIDGPSCRRSIPFFLVPRNKGCHFVLLGGRRRN